MATLKLSNKLFTVQKGATSNKDHSNVIEGSRRKREMVQFHYMESNTFKRKVGHKIISMLYFWQITLTILQTPYRNFQMRLGVKLLLNTQKSHRHVAET